MLLGLSDDLVGHEPGFIVCFRSYNLLPEMITGNIQDKYHFP